ncbi:unnamed protein product [Spodoptera exigua]|nr:unnamed protein product [Spodoptera exigua]
MTSLAQDKGRAPPSPILLLLWAEVAVPHGAYPATPAEHQPYGAPSVVVDWLFEARGTLRRVRSGDSETPVFDEKNKDHWNMQAQWILQSKLSNSLNTKVAKNVILFLGDGMSITTLAATRVYLGQKYGHLGEELKLSFEAFPYTGLSKVC